MKIARVIGVCANSYPDKWEFYALLPLEKEYRLDDWDFRTPEINAHIKNSKHTSSNQWHQDCHGNNALLILWSNREATEIRSKTTKRPLPAFAPGQIILINNLLCEHRTPATMTADRTFVRITVTCTHPNYPALKELLS